MEQEPSNGCSFVRNRKKKKSQEEETTEHQFGKQKTCKGLIMALISNPCSGLEQKEQQ